MHMDEKISVIKQWLGSGSINFFGPPFSGKDTQAGRLAELIGGRVVSGGDILRHSQDNVEVQRVMAEGGIVPTELFLQIVPPFFGHPDLQGVPLLLSSVGRLMEEVKVIEAATNESGHKQKAVVLLNLPVDGIWHHFEVAQAKGDRGVRADDTREALQVRIDKFAETASVVEHYRQEGLVLDIDDTRSPEEVFELIVDALYQKAKSEL